MKQRMRVIEDGCEVDVFTRETNGIVERYNSQYISLVDTGDRYLYTADDKRVAFHYGEMADLLEILLWQERNARKRGNHGLRNKNAIRAYTVLKPKRKKKK